MEEAHLPLIVLADKCQETLVIVYWSGLVTRMILLGWLGNVRETMRIFWQIKCHFVHSCQHTDYLHPSKEIQSAFHPVIISITSSGSWELNYFRLFQLIAFFPSS